MSTRTGARIYRGPNRALVSEACPHCFRIVNTRNGRRRRHQDGDGRPCTGGGVAIGASDAYVLPGDLPDVVYGSVICRGCGRQIPLNNDGAIRRHRIRHQDPFAPYCEPRS